MHKIIAGTILGTTVLFSGLALKDASSFDGVPAKQISSEEIQADTKDISVDETAGIVEAKLPLRDTKQLTMKYDMNPDSSERVSDKMNRQIEVKQAVNSDLIAGGGVEMSIILLSEPDSNIFNFPIDGYKDFDFVYQPPLWQEYGLKAPTANCSDTLCTNVFPSIVRDTRPEEVVGSYVAYLKDSSPFTNDPSQPQEVRYLRPKITDANGNWSWVSMSYSNGVMTYTPDRTWLHTAVYPVKF